jgi:hypothetical protein
MEFELERLISRARRSERHPLNPFNDSNVMPWLEDLHTNGMAVMVGTVVTCPTWRGRRQGGELAEVTQSVARVEFTPAVSGCPRELLVSMRCDLLPDDPVRDLTAVGPQGG